MGIYKQVFHRLKSSCCTRYFKLCFLLLKCSRLLHLFQRSSRKEAQALWVLLKSACIFLFFIFLYVQSKNSSSSPKILLQPREKVVYLSSNILSAEMTSAIDVSQNLLCDRVTCFPYPVCRRKLLWETFPVNHLSVLARKQPLWNKRNSTSFISTSNLWLSENADNK